MDFSSSWAQNFSKYLCFLVDFQFLFPLIYRVYYAILTRSRFFSSTFLRFFFHFSFFHSFFVCCNLLLLYALHIFSIRSISFTLSNKFVYLHIYCFQHFHPSISCRIQLSFHHDLSDDFIFVVQSFVRFLLRNRC